MKLADAAAIVNGIHIMEIQVDATHALFNKMSANYALVHAVEREPGNPSAGMKVETHGKCSAFPTNWSERTIKCLHELIESMEEDLLPQHFDVDKEDSHGTDGERAFDRGAEGPAQV